MNILIFENDFSAVENTFKYVNLKYFNNSLNFTVFSKSQDIGDFKNLEHYDFIFLDITLANRSNLDGFGILKKIRDEKINIKKLVIITGNGDIKNRLKEQNLKDYPIILKPLPFDAIYSFLKP
ncbi:hypothetical protein KIH23_12170 [Flavobacterium sp. CYK-55]|uniref:hypothetical protein n=1 Tax=Flavobacterium sp. CYK-55 TaxID=2835529 RepID=UPI001BCC9CBE|nr:hypothetical protein [Flavobacterium sp. CYK-55]MBS7788054.1 hypothetical protein [Flavobacterium sp. CYK-55]